MVEAIRAKAREGSPLEKIPPSVPKGIINEELVRKAVSALLLYHDKQEHIAENETVGDRKQPLLGTHTSIYVNFGLDVAPQPGQARANKPHRIPIPHPVYNVPQIGAASDKDEPASRKGLGGNVSDTGDEREEPEVCLIVKDDDTKASIEGTLRQFFSKVGSGCLVKKVLTLATVRKEYERFAARRELVASYDVFFCDDRIFNMMNTLGREFSKHNKIPMPIAVTRSLSFPYRILEALSSTYIKINLGTNCSARVGYTHMSKQQLAENTLAAIHHAADNIIPRSWSNVKTITIKTPNSIALPIYQQSPEGLLELARMANLPPVWVKSPRQSKPKADLPAEGQEEQPAKTSVENKKRTLDRDSSPLVKALKKSKVKNDSKRKPSFDESIVERRESKRKPGAPDPEPVKQAAQKRDVPAQDVPKSAGELQALSSSKKAKETTKKGPPEGNEQFHACKKYRGAKVGYVFKMGFEGLGYYVDQKPIVDKMALAAIHRMAAAKSGDGRQGSSRNGRAHGFDQKRGNGNKRRR
jgi:ribosome biogenesis protein UTP30